MVAAERRKIRSLELSQPIGSRLPNQPDSIETGPVATQPSTLSVRQQAWPRRRECWCFGRNNLTSSRLAQQRSRVLSKHLTEAECPILIDTTENHSSTSFSGFASDGALNTFLYDLIRMFYL
jgi:hypothetical protein